MCGRRKKSSKVATAVTASLVDTVITISKGEAGSCRDCGTVSGSMATDRVQDQL
jgi:hypothetical protein